MERAGQLMADFDDNDNDDSDDNDSGNDVIVVNGDNGDADFR